MITVTIKSNEENAAIANPKNASLRRILLCHFTREVINSASDGYRALLLALYDNFIREVINSASDSTSSTKTTLVNVLIKLYDAMFSSKRKNSPVSEKFPNIWEKLSVTLNVCCLKLSSIKVMPATCIQLKNEKSTTPTEPVTVIQNEFGKFKKPELPAGNLALHSGQTVVSADISAPQCWQIFIA
jgi:hypothetical protein